MALSPYDPLIYAYDNIAGMAYLVDGQYERAIECALRSLRENRTYTLSVSAARNRAGLGRPRGRSPSIGAAFIGTGAGTDGSGVPAPLPRQRQPACRPLLRCPHASRDFRFLVRARPKLRANNPASGSPVGRTPGPSMRSRERSAQNVCRSREFVFGVFERLLSVAEFAQVNLQFGGIDFGALVDPGVFNSDGGRDG